ncbi:helix-turn-helix transcriptional regulator [Gallionella capsiferriformans]|uniref:Prophage CP4-57 regulatory n=1 Tax=Gallionella capsiferriformans (strain ES-2) TaxID=395494 RepID=D9SDK5_GALCS|nr:AlpA family phage regulatory protein [Gallionella capsiferriformans]ADL54762.1 Prophage CP4-57 regulatory [Gallionella capsiferriformans ES-2]
MGTVIKRLKAVQALTGLARSTIYLRIKDGLWPRPISLGGRAVGWPENEISTINVARVAGKSDQDIREIVINLEAARKTTA